MLEINEYEWPRGHHTTPVRTKEELEKTHTHSHGRENILPIVNIYQTGK